jgi:hypothetical protein
MGVEENGDAASILLKACAVFLIGVLILSGIVSENVTGDTHSARISLTDNPVDGDIITINTIVFEFDSGDGVVAGHIPVSIGATLAETTENLNSALESNTDFIISMA